MVRAASFSEWWLPGPHALLCLKSTMPAWQRWRWRLPHTCAMASHAAHGLAAGMRWVKTVVRYNGSTRDSTASAATANIHGLELVRLVHIVHHGVAMVFPQPLHRWRAWKVRGATRMVSCLGRNLTHPKVDCWEPPRRWRRGCASPWLMALGGELSRTSLPLQMPWCLLLLLWVIFTPPGGSAAVRSAVSTSGRPAATASTAPCSCSRRLVGLT
mmetsp:Transcript_7920/g.17531  ORF Transcript_7920/g.17531 Transcript_7920/m.17531 type:complete len:214 (+) Transcript_7920:1125-1766(+)